MNKTIASVWAVAPELGIPEPPALLAESDRLWLAYFLIGNEAVAVVRFSDVIDHHLSPINDEGLGKHPYAQAGLKWYSFNELTDSNETRRWTTLGARHWVINFKDNTLDVIAKSAEVIHEKIPATSPLQALLSVVQSYAV
jgi:hypothetical protein